ncbi:hypothetical protein K466DRAFT_282008 [Polyporus arcularius HHB13444]|uniref:Uncharacterized protein n=1 Tax=Polyporus arcularius HHB13444 TaxID=1314778 RepID=A0A5C3P3N4_9APHY|nr:hypothetical protein K466DRAFT_282008 [Polyporus arcularius HHB13444]
MGGAAHRASSLVEYSLCATALRSSEPATVPAWSHARTTPSFGPQLALDYIDFPLRIAEVGVRVSGLRRQAPEYRAEPSAVANCDRHAKHADGHPALTVEHARHVRQRHWPEWRCANHDARMTCRCSGLLASAFLFPGLWLCTIRPCCSRAR